MTAPMRPALPAAPPPTHVRPMPARGPHETGPRITTRFEDTGERDRVFTWLEDGLRPGRPGRLAREFPQLFAADSAAVPVTVWAEGRPASFCFLWPVRFELARGRLRTGLISLVYSDPGARGRGLARAAIARALREAAARELGLCLLWSELSAFYTDQGFSRAGHESLLVVDADVLARARARIGADRARGARIERARVEDWSAIAALRAQRACHAPLPALAPALAALPDMDGRVARGPEGIRAFALCGRGDDFQGVVHEWGGQAGALIGCLEALVAEPGSEGGILVLAPGEAHRGPASSQPNAPGPLAHCLRAAGARRLENPLAFFAIASLPALVADLTPLAPSLFGAQRIEAACAGAPPFAPITLTDRTSGRACALSPAEFLALLFSPETDPIRSNAGPKIDSIVPPAARAELPLPFFVWGLESI
ncbi:GNAT family N-acetyltransferase [Myxococcota bacterium]|nr:GNAT family N-acetyltransferase [Myxococcota bacterium]